MDSRYSYSDVQVEITVRVDGHEFHFYGSSDRGSLYPEKLYKTHNSVEVAIARAVEGDKYDPASYAKGLDATMRRYSGMQEDD